MRKLLFCLLAAFLIMSALAEDEVTIAISAAGDCTLGGDVRDTGYATFQRLFDTYGAESFLSGVREVFEADDLSIVNFEGAIPEEPYYLEDKRFNFRCLPSCTDILTHSGIEAVTVANNHSFDFGKSAYDNTINVLEGSGLTVFGNEKYASMEIKGVNIAICGFTWWDNYTETMNTVSSLKDTCDILIVTMHWGSEGEYWTDETQTWWAYGLIDSGADLILGCHTHLLGGIEKYKNRYIVYSMGNFCFGGNTYPNDYDSFIFRQELTVSKGVITESRIDIIPCLISSDGSFNNCHPIIADGYDALRIKNKVMTYSTKAYQFDWITEQ